MKWDEYFSTEDELIDALRKLDIIEYKRRFLKGFIYLESFQRQLNKGKPLTDKQLIQLKRLAGELYKYYHWE